MTLPLIPGMPPSGSHPGHGPATRRKDEEHLVQQLEASRQSMVEWWRECAAFASPRSPKFPGDKDRRGNYRNRHLINEAAVYARRTLESGLHWGITNPSRRWFELKTGILELDELPAVKEYNHTVADRIFTVMGRSNFYDIQALAYSDAITYATAAYLVEEDDEDIINCVPFAIGQFAIGDNHKRDVTTVSRTISLTLRQVYDQFCPMGRDGVRDTSVLSAAALDLIDKKQWEHRIDVTHLIYPNPDFDESRDLPEFFRYASLYWETGHMPKDAGKQYLRKSGYREWPLMTFRWRRGADDAWGVDCPTMQALGSTMSLQTMEKKGLKLLEKLVDPPMTGPGELEGKAVSILPGAFTATRDPNTQLRAAHEVRADALRELREDKWAVVERINDLYYTKLMLLVANDTRSQRPTAREVEEGSQEKYLVLGSVLESFNGTFRQLIDRIFAIMQRGGYLPEPPEELDGIPLTIEYTSIMAVAQKSVGLVNIERYGYTVLEMAAKVDDPRFMATMNWEEYLRALEARSGLPPKLLRTKEEVDEIMRGMAQAQDEERQAALMAQEAKATKDLSAAPIGGMDSRTSALDALVAAGQGGSLAGAMGAG